MEAARPEEVTTGKQERVQLSYRDTGMRRVNKKNTKAAISGVEGWGTDGTTYRNVWKKSLSNTETCWTADDQFRHGHAPLGKKGLGRS